MKLRKDSKHSEDAVSFQGAGSRFVLGNKRKTGYGKCANKDCSNTKKQKRKAADRSAAHCDVRTADQPCARLLESVDFCHICKSATIGNKEGVEWIQCDLCSRWNHIECEENSKNGIKNLAQKLQEETQDASFKCLDCRSQAPSSRASPGRRKDSLRSSPPDENDFSRFVGSTKTAKKAAGAPPEPSFSYIYSENYQPIEKIVCGKGQQLSLTNEEVNADLEQLKSAELDTHHSVASPQQAADLHPKRD